MMKKTTLVLSLSMVFSCFPAAQPAQNSIGQHVWNGGKVTIGGLLALLGVKAIYNAVSPKVRKQMKEDFEKQRDEAREQVRSQGGNVEIFDEQMEQVSKVMAVMPVITGCVGAGMTLGGGYLAWRGITALRNPVQ